MAGDWIKFEVETPDKPEVIHIAGLTKQGLDSVVGKLLRVWVWFDKHTSDGNAVGVTLASLDDIARCQGFAQAMLDAGWLKERANGLLLPNFDRHNGETSKKRALTAKRQSRFRNAAADGQVTLFALPREEKRREEKEEEKTGAGAPVDWIPADAWEAFVDHRRQKRAKLTAKAVELIVKKLADYRNLGVEPRTVLDFAIESGHTGLYYKSPQKSSNGHAGNGTAPALAAWAELRSALRAGKEPKTWTHDRTPAALDAIGGWQALKYAETKDIDFKQRTFVDTFNAGAH